ncbi:origin recognition complex subunit 5 [Haematobia irritans]|uniref:origin recognition complex subunit 5 n=1 Tax=Haematobia irritans TaxID=7368 RepID=UPI003F4F97B7
MKIVEHLDKKYPCRTEFIQNLYALLSNPDENFPPSIFISGHAGTGKSVVVKSFLRICKQQKKYSAVLVNCVECYSSKLLYDHILEEFVGNESRCETLKDFVETLREFDVGKRNSYVIALDNADRLRDMENILLPSFLRLQEFLGINICVLLISQIPLEKYHCKTGLSELVSIHFPQYTKLETLKILSTQYGNTINMIKARLPNMIEGSDLEKQYDIVNMITQDFYNNYLNIFLSVFYKACRDVPELKTTANKYFLTYMEPIFSGMVEMTDVARLWRHIVTPLKSALSQVYMRYDSTQNYVSPEPIEDYKTDQRLCKIAQAFELPFYGKYLVIAAFLASHNSAKDDKRLFVKHHGKQRKRTQNVIAKSKVVEKMSTSLGPKSFNLDRLLAIFYAILDEKVGLTCNLLSQISTLLHLKLLAFVSGENNIMDGSARLQCTVGLELTLYIGKMVGFNVYQYLCDFI